MVHILTCQGVLFSNDVFPGAKNLKQTLESLVKKSELFADLSLDCLKVKALRLRPS